MNPEFPMGFELSKQFDSERNSGLTWNVSNQKGNLSDCVKNKKPREYTRDIAAHW